MMNLSENKPTLQLACLQDVKGINPFVDKIKAIDCYPLKSSNTIDTLQVNTGKRCNLMCKHCHVEAGPDRTEMMSRETMFQILQVLADSKIPNLDITGGAPELNLDLPWFIKEAKKLGCHVIVRTNLSVLGIQEYSFMASFYAEHNVELCASLPYYSAKDHDRQRGEGVFLNSIEVLIGLNKLGYGKPDGELKINLVYNPGGAFLPPIQQAMEADYRKVLMDQYGIFFNLLYTIANVPVGRFLSFLNNSGNLQRYMQRLANNFNPLAINKVMCKEQVSVGWDGQLYDCDFNQMLGLKCSPGHIKDFNLAVFAKREIILGNHCYACTAGAGSSCGGATTI